MHGIFTYSYPKNGPNVGKYSLRGGSELTIFGVNMCVSVFRIGFLLAGNVR